MSKLHFTFILLCVYIFSACQVENESLKDSNQSLTIILSKQNSSSSHIKFIEKLDSTIEINWINAYTTPLSEIDNILERADGIIMTGGVDIHPGLYGQAFDTIKCGTIDLKRDEIEMALLDFALENGTPCLGICRGHQFMNVHLGGSLHPNLPDTLSNIHRGESGSTTHSIQILKKISAIF